jgi:signal transduction histidine kinase
MSLRVRLAFLYTTIMGGVLLLFGTVVYISVSIILTNQLDRILEDVAQDIYKNTQPFVSGELLVTFPDIDLSTDVYIQVWDQTDELVDASRNLPPNFSTPLDLSGLNSRETIFRNTSIGQAQLRVLTVPLVISGTDRLVATVQIAVSRSVVDSTQNVLLYILVLGTLAAMLIAGFAGWYSTNQVLEPLEIVTETALLITRADDLSRRIVYEGPPEDEVGQLISAFNQTLERLENLFNSQRRFLADVGHELRTPLTVIKGNIDLMRRLNCTDEESMTSIEGEVERLTRLVGDLLLLAQAESGKLPLAWGLVELDTLIFDVLQQMRVLARDKLTLKLGEIDQVLVCGDPDRLKQVLVNLIGNAINYTPKGGEVIVSVGKEKERAKLSVCDSGPGIPKDDMPYIFERFYRGEKSRTRSKDGKGFGLGLSIAYWIVRNHGGQIEVGSRQPTGTKFTVWLPLAKGGCSEEK